MLSHAALKKELEQQGQYIQLTIPIYGLYIILESGQVLLITSGCVFTCFDSMRQLIQNSCKKLPKRCEKNQDPQNCNKIKEN